MTDGGCCDDERLAYAFRRCLARPPSEAETAALLGLLERQAKRFDSGGLDPWALAASDPKSPPKLPDGTTQIHQLIIGRELVGLRAFA